MKALTFNDLIDNNHEPIEGAEKIDFMKSKIEQGYAVKVEKEFQHRHATGIYVVDVYVWCNKLIERIINAVTGETRFYRNWDDSDIRHYRLIADNLAA